MDINSWQVLQITSKWFSLLAMAGVIGGLFSLGLARHARLPELPALTHYITASALFGLCITLLYFLIQVGAINESGISGMLDTGMASIVWRSQLGNAIGLRAAGFLLIVILWLLFGRSAGSTNNASVYHNSLFLILCGVIALVVSFSLTGHTSGLAISAHVAIVLHVLAAFLWVGSLYSLWLLSGVDDVPKIQKLLKMFGHVAVYIVAVLVLSGTFLLTMLLESFVELLSTSYGLTVLVKLTGVVVLLMLAATNKLILVPRLTQQNSARLLRLSIKIEIAAALCVLAATTWLTTSVGPANL